MDFIVGLRQTARKKDSIWVIVDRLTKTAHFIAVHTTYLVLQYAELYMDQIVRLHGIPKTIISGRGTQFAACFWEQLHECLRTKLIRSSSYHPQTDGQTKRINQILEDMLRASILHFDKSWDKCLSLAKFSYGKSYQASLKMAPLDALCGRRFCTPLNWSETRERTLFGPNFVKDAEAKVKVIRENFKMAQMRQKSYRDKGTAPRHFAVGEYMYLKVSPTKGVRRFGVKGKLAPHYIGTYEVIEVCGLVAYRIQLPEQFSAVHNVFHVTQLKKGMLVPENEVITEANAWIEPDFSLIEHPLRVLDQKERKTRRKVVRMYKIQWSHHMEEEATWETEEYLNTKYQGFLQFRNREFYFPCYCS
jgi:hypothetical protein